MVLGPISLPDLQRQANDSVPKHWPTITDPTNLLEAKVSVDLGFYVEERRAVVVLGGDNKRVGNRKHGRGIVFSARPHQGL